MKAWILLLEQCALQQPHPGSELLGSSKVTQAALQKPLLAVDALPAAVQAVFRKQFRPYDLLLHVVYEALRGLAGQGPPKHRLHKTLRADRLLAPDAGKPQLLAHQLHPLHCLALQLGVARVAAVIRPFSMRGTTARVRTSMRAMTDRSRAHRSTCRRPLPWLMLRSV